MAAKRTLSLFLLKPEAGRPADALSATRLSSYEVGGLRDARLFLRRTQRDEPEWLRFLRPHLDRKPTVRSTATLSGVLVFRLGERWFALTFGYGRTLLDPEMVVADFGLKAALNSVDPDELRSVDAKTLEELTVNTRRQLSRGASITSFELDLHRDLIKAVRGKSSDATFADQVSGSAALRLTSDIRFEEIEDRVRTAYKRYGSRRYRRRFGWIDHVQLVTDPLKIAELDNRLEDQVQSHDAEGLFLAAPVVLDEDDFGGFQLLRKENAVVFDLRWEDYIELKPEAPSLTTLKRDLISVVSAASGEAADRWSVYRALIFEFQDGGTRYVLSGGDWFAVDPSYARETRRYIETFESDSLRLPGAAHDEDEGNYNERASRSFGSQARLLDRKLFEATESQDRVEFCDLLVKPNRIVHIKRKSGSSTLSHLFNQGVVSGELLHSDEGFREAVRQELRTPQGFAGFIPSGSLNPQSFEVGYGVISRPAVRNRHFLPFFSQVSFRRAAEHLSARGYAVSLMRIDSQ